MGAAVLFGTGLGSALLMWRANRMGDIQTIASVTGQVVIADWIFTGTAGMLQPVTGFWMIYLNHYPIHSLWVLGSLIGYVVAGLFWLPVVYFQMQLRDLAKEALRFSKPLSEKYKKIYACWFYSGWPAFIALIVVFYLMANQPNF